MGWEARRGGQYYYEKVREGKRVVSRYVGSGLLGECAATLARQQQLEQTRQRLAIRAKREEEDAVAGDVDAVYAGIETLMRAVLTLSGYHQQDRHWRKRRKAVTNGDTQ